MTTSMLFSNFTTEDVDKHFALEKAGYSDVHDDLQYFAKPLESKTIDRVMQDLAVQYVNARLAIESDGPLKASMTVLPGDTTNADGQLNLICEMPLNLRKSESFDRTQPDKMTNTSLSSLKIVMPTPKDEEKGCAVTSCLSPCRRKRLWILIFRRLVLIMEITQMKRRLELTAMISSLPISPKSVRISRNYFGRNSRRYSQIYELIAAGPSGKIKMTSTDSSAEQVGFGHEIESPVCMLNAPSWEEITSHRVDTRTGSRCPQKWNPDGRTLGDKLATTTLFRRSQIRQSRFSLLPLIPDQRRKSCAGDVVGFARRGAALTPSLGQRRGTDPITAFFTEKDQIADLKNKTPFLKPLSIPTKDSAALTLFGPSSGPQSTESSSATDLCVTSNEGSEEEGAQGKQTEDGSYELEFHPRIKKTLTPLAWNSKGSNTQSCDKLTEHFGFFGAKSQNGVGSRSRIFQSRKRHSLGYSPAGSLVTRDALRETRRKSSGSNAESLQRNKRPVVPEIPRSAVLMAQLKSGLSFSKLAGVITCMRESFSASEKKDKDNETDNENEKDTVLGVRSLLEVPVEVEGERESEEEGEGESEGECSAVTGEYESSVDYDEISCNTNRSCEGTNTAPTNLLQCSSAQSSVFQNISETPLGALAMAL